MCSIAFVGASASARADLEAFHISTSIGAAAMVSADQSGRMGFDSLGMLGGAQLGYPVAEWLDVQLGISAGGFPSEGPAGGVLAPLAGAAVRWPGARLRPFLQLNAGPGFTGALTRPFAFAAIGVEAALGSAILLGPAIGYGHVFQWDGPRHSSDARFLWFGLTASWRGSPRPPVKQRSTLIVRRRDVTRIHRAAPPPTPTAPRPPVEPSPELLLLLEQAVPSAKTELLAPVLFQLDSAELEPIGVAMLHEVARELQRRPQIELLEIVGYADARGTGDYNLALSERRAQRVLEWLVEHGIARDRLRVAPRGASELVEHGESEGEHAQNRRVVFRVVTERRP